MPRFIDTPTLYRACQQLPGTCGNFAFVWFVLKQKGLNEETPIVIDTKNVDEACTKLWSWGDPQGTFLFPMSATARFRTRKKDAGRSVVQTNVKQWMDNSGATTKTDQWLDIRQTPDKKYAIMLKHGYGDYLGQGTTGLANEDGTRTSIPILAFSIWYGRKTAIPDNCDADRFLIDSMKSELNINDVEEQCIFVDQDCELSFAQKPLTDQEIFGLLREYSKESHGFIEKPETLEEHIERIRTVQTIRGDYDWLSYAPSQELTSVLDSGEKAVLLVGAPRTGKSRAVRQYASSKTISEDAITYIQLHDGWTYNHLILGQTINDRGVVEWKEGPLLHSIRSNKKIIVLEEANRTRLSEALGEVFQALEPAYRDFPIVLADRSELIVPSETIFIFTMNNVDKSTEDIDDALMGRTAAVEFYPRVEDLSSILSEKKVSETLSNGLRKFFKRICDEYPLGHGYYSSLPNNPDVDDVIRHYITHIRPVLNSHFSASPEIISGLDKSFQELIVAPMDE